MITKWRFTLVCLTFAILGITTLGQSLSPDSLFPLQKYFSLLCLFCFYMLSLWSCGSIIGRKIFLLEHKILYLPLGAAFFSYVSYLFSEVSLIGTQYSLLQFLFLSAWPIAIGFTKPEQFNFSNFELNRKIFAPLLVLIIFILLFLQASIPSFHGDPLYYHLLAPRLWFDQGQINFIHSAPLLYQSGPWEYLYLQLMHLAPAKQGLGLISHQILAQWLHLSLGVFTSYLILEKIFEPQVPNPLKRTLIILSALLSIELIEIAPSAKNDWGIILWSLSAIFLLEVSNKGNKSLRLLAAIFTGLAICGKWTNSIVLVPILVYYFIQQSWRLKQLLFFSFFVFVSMLPILFRNYFDTGDAFFPLLQRILEKPIVSLSDLAMLQSVTADFSQYSPQQFLTRVQALFQSHIAAVLFVMVPILIARSISVSKYCIPIFAAFIIYILFISYAVSWRVFGLGLLFWNLIALLTIERLSRSWKLPYNISHLIIGVFLLTQIIHVTKQTEVFDLPRVRNPAIVIRQFPAAQSMAWLRLNASTNELIAFGGNNQHYYLSHLNVVTVETNPRFNEFLRNLKSRKDAVLGLQKLGVRYFVETRNKLPWGKSALFLTKVIDQSPESVSYRGHSSRVVDIEKLTEFVQSPKYRALPIHYKGSILIPQK